MDGVFIPFLPAGTWIVASAFLLLLLLVIFGYHVYQRSRIRALTGDSGDIAKLAALKEQLLADVTVLKEKLTNQKSEIFKLEGERRQQELVRAELTQLEKALAAKRQENHELISKAGDFEYQLELKRRSLDELERQIGGLDHQIELKRQHLDELKKEISALDAKNAEATVLERQLEELRREIESQKVLAGRTAEIEAKYTALSVQAQLLEHDISSHKQTLKVLKIEKLKTQEELAKLRQMATTERGTQITVQQEVNTLTARKEALTVELEKLRINLDDTKKKTTVLERQLEELRSEIEDLKVQAGRTAEIETKYTALSVQAQMLEHDISSHIEQIKVLRNEKLKTQEELAKLRQVATTERGTQITMQHEVSALTARKEALTVELEKLRGQFGGSASIGDKEAPYDDLLKVPPTCLDRDAFTDETKELNESNLLHQFRDTLRVAGYFFSKRVIDAFHTSLKCHDINPLTVLAGVSGTGKTLLPIRYAEFMGMHRLVMAVQPRWDSPQDMFGFYNYLEKKYKASELSRALVRMDPYNYVKDFKANELVHHRMLLVLLDEMNLARTEYYFSEFLSKLELQRMVDDPSNEMMRIQAELELDAGPGARHFRVWVPKNIFFVGTMNEDETTQTLSDKVLDRSNVLRFGKPDEKADQIHEHSLPSNRDGKHERKRDRERSLLFSTWKSWLRYPKDSDWQKEVNRWIWELNSSLDGIGLPFGFRVRQAMLAYVANYPRTEDDNRYKLAFADQIEQKILPKLRGLDMNESAWTATLQTIGTIIQKLGDAPLEDAFRKAQQESTTTGMFHWRGVTRRVDEDS
ncbi:MAG: AAA family ATPase [Deltaproteobacteria bacterium]|jgi:hypothetical protein|nr:AAA family ATPase [Deltaproteobacteria bacterium]